MIEPFRVTQLSEEENVILIELFTADWDQYHQAMEQAFAIVAATDGRCDFILKPPLQLPGKQPLTHFRHTTKTWLKHHNLASITLGSVCKL